MPRFDQLLRAAFRNPLIVVLDLLFGVLVVSCLVNGAYRAAAYTAGFIVMLKLDFIVCSLLLARYRKPPQPAARTAEADPKKGPAALTAASRPLDALGSWAAVKRSTSASVALGARRSASTTVAKLKATPVWRM